MPTNKCYVLVDDDGNTVWGCVYASRKLAQEAIDERRQANEESKVRSANEQFVRFEQERAEYQALYIAGLRDRPWTREFKAWHAFWHEPKIEEWTLFLA